MAIITDLPKRLFYGSLSVGLRACGVISVIGQVRVVAYIIRPERW